MKKNLTLQTATAAQLIERLSYVEACPQPLTHSGEPAPWPSFPTLPAAADLTKSPTPQTPQGTPPPAAEKPPGLFRRIGKAMATLLSELWEPDLHPAQRPVCLYTDPVLFWLAVPLHAWPSLRIIILEPSIPSTPPADNTAERPQPPQVSGLPAMPVPPLPSAPASVATPCAASALGHPSHASSSPFPNSYASKPISRVKLHSFLHDGTLHILLP